MKDKTVIAHLSDQNGALTSQIKSLSGETTALSRSNKQLSTQLSQSQQTCTDLRQSVTNLQQELRTCRSAAQEAERKANQTVDSLRSAQVLEANANAELHGKEVQRASAASRFCLFLIFKFIGGKLNPSGRDKITYAS